jgi:hypothetical protein
MENLKVVKKKVEADTVITVIIDASGSMGGIVAATMEGYNAFITKQREEEGTVLVSLILFDSGWGNKLRLVRPYTALPLDEVPELTREVYEVGGGTPLRDAIGNGISQTDDILKTVKTESPDALVVIITDGGENTSRNYGAGLVKEMITKREGDGWTFIYMGANQDSWAETQDLGFQKGNVMNYAAADIKEGAFAKVAASTVAYRGMSSTAKAGGLVGSYTTTAFFADAGVTEDAPVESSTDAKTDA